MTIYEAMKRADVSQLAELIAAFACACPDNCGHIDDCDRGCINCVEKRLKMEIEKRSN